MKIRLWIVSAVFLLLMAASSAFLFFYLNPQAVLQAYASYALGRKVTIGSTKLELYPLNIEAEDIHVANATWGSQADMLRIAHIKACPQGIMFFLGHPSFRFVLIEGASLELERNDKGTGNWKRSGGQSAALSPAQAAVRNRNAFPTMLELMVKDSHIVMHTSSGMKLQVDFKNLQLQADDERQPVMLNVLGAYNHIPVHMHITTQPYAVLHDVLTPFAADIDAEGATASIKAELQMMDPLNFDRFSGLLHVTIQNTGEALAFFGNRLQWRVPLLLESDFAREGDVWAFTGARGRLAGNDYEDSTLRLTEGKRKEPDSLQGVLHFDIVDVRALMEPHDGGAAKPFVIDASRQPSVLLDAALTAEKVSYEKLTASHVKLHAGIIPGGEALDDISMDIFGGTLHASFVANGGEKAPLITAKAELSHADMQAVLQVLGVKDDVIKGNAVAHFSATARGNSIKAWSQSLQGSVYASLVQGEISRHLVRVASADVRVLLPGGASMLAMPCAVAVAGFARGRGTVSPFRVETAEGVLLGAGTVDLPQRMLDVVFQTDPGTTSALAFNFPIYVVGNFGDPHIVPRVQSKISTDFGLSRNTSCGKMP